MGVVRRFLIAPSLVRLIRRERGNFRITEGYFTPQPDRISFVRIDGGNCHLVMTKPGSEGRDSEDCTEVPRAHGEALLDVCAGKITCERTTLAIDGRDLSIDRYVTPSTLDLAYVAFGDGNAAEAYKPPAWFGDDVSSDAAYARAAIAIHGVPVPREITPTNAALDALLDALDTRLGAGGMDKARIAA